MSFQSSTHAKRKRQIDLVLLSFCRFMYESGAHSKARRALGRTR